MNLRYQTARGRVGTWRRASVPQAGTLPLISAIVGLSIAAGANSLASEYGTVQTPAKGDRIFSEHDESLSADGQTGLADFNTELDGKVMVLWHVDEEPEFIYAPDGYRSLYGRDLSADGSRVAGWTYRGGTERIGFVWTRETGVQILSPPYDGDHSPNLISGDGQVVLGRSGTSGDWDFWRWTEADGFQQLPVDYEETGLINGMTPDASTLVLTHGVYHADGWLELAPENENGSRPILSRISDDARYVVGRVDWDGPDSAEHQLEAIRWELGTGDIQQLGTLAAIYPKHSRSSGRAMSADGELILGASGTATSTCNGGHADAFVWDERHGMRALSNVLREEYGLDVGLPSLYGPRLGMASGISDDKRTIFGHTWDSNCGASELWYARLDWPLGTIRGDLEWDGDLDVADLDKLLGFIREGQFDSQSDFNFDNVVDQADLAFWVRDLKQTYFGDANLDGEFNSSDLVSVFETGQYEDSEPLNSTWGTGDWNGDGDFTTSDLVSAFAEGGYEQGPRPAPQAVPEPEAHSLMLAAFAFMVTLVRHRIRIQLRRL